MLYVKNPIQNEAIQFIKLVDTGLMGLKGAELSEYPKWFVDRQTTDPLADLQQGAWCISEGNLWIGTKEGHHLASEGDFIVKGIQGEIYPVKPDIFAATYTSVTEESYGITVFNAKLRELIQLVRNHASRDASLTITKLEEAGHWMNMNKPWE